MSLFSLFFVVVRPEPSTFRFDWQVTKKKAQRSKRRERWNILS